MPARHTHHAMKNPTYGPVYCAMYPELAAIARQHGYALAIHGSTARDFDLVCIPWVESPSEPRAVVDAMCSRFAIKAAADSPVMRLHGREVWMINIAWGECAIDLSFMPRIEGPQ